MNNYCNEQEVDQYATEQRYDDWLLLSEGQKRKIVNQATLDIETYHKQPRQYGEPWGDFREAAVLQSLYIERTRDLREYGEKIRAVTDGDYDDRVITASASTMNALDPIVRVMVINKLNALVNAGEFGRA